MRIKDSVVVITGASSGIGRATALAAARRGAAVVLAARRRDALEQVARECESHGAQALAVPTDVTDAKAVDDLARGAVERFGRIDVWVNVAAVALFGPFSQVPLEDIRRTLDVNVMGYVHGARAALAQMRQQGHGVLIDVASVVGIVAQPYTHAYGMSKFGVRALSASLRQELWLEGAHGIKVCAVLPATIDTPLFEHAANYTGRKPVAMPPVYTPERVARVILDLVRWPRREVMVGSAGRSLVLQSRLAPGMTEKAMAVIVDRVHLSRQEPAPPSDGNLHEAFPGPGSVHGGWNGRRRTAVRRAGAGAMLLGAAVAGARRRGR